VRIKVPFIVIETNIFRFLSSFLYLTAGSHFALCKHGRDSPRWMTFGVQSVCLMEEESTPNGEDCDGLQTVRRIHVRRSWLAILRTPGTVGITT
jgi:hypothetical protein